MNTTDQPRAVSSHDLFNPFEIMTYDDIKEYWPKASIAQARAIQVYHNAGWQINPQEDDGMIPCHRPDTMETVEHSLIASDGRMIPPPNE